MSDSDRPNNPSDSGGQGQSNGGGWQQPTTPGAWRNPDTPAQSSGWQTATPAQQPETTSSRQGWRVPTLPRELDSQPTDAGGWHLPKPEDTRFSSEDVSEVTLEPEATPPAESLPFEPVAATGEPEAVADGAADPPVEEAQAAVEEAFLPFDDDTMGASPASFDEALEDALAAEADTLDDEDDEDEEGFSMSELVALASLADEEVSQAATPVETSDEDLAVTDPEEYARRELERLAQQAEADIPVDLGEDLSQDATAAFSATEQLSPTATDPNAQPVADEAAADAGAGDAVAQDPAEIARQQIERLTGGGADFAPIAQATTPAQPAVALTPEQEELAQRFENTQNRVQDLRVQYQNGQMSRDDLQNELRQLMVLDGDQVWWMMGVETDTWYKFDNNEWVTDTPEVLQLKQQAEASQAAAAQQTAVPGIDTAQGVTPPPGSDDYMPLPKQVPINDPEGTVPSTGGMFLGDEAAGVSFEDAIGGEQTVQSAGFNEAATVPAGGYDDDLLDPDSYVSVESADGAVYDPTAPPDYDAVEDVAPSFEDAQKRQQQELARRLLLIALVILGLFFLVGAGVVLVGVSQYNEIIGPFEEDIAALESFESPFQTVRILDAEGNQIAELTSPDGGARDRVTLDQISPEMIFAVVALENERFYVDAGWDPIAVARALTQNLIAGEVESGASTITQQLARNLILQDSSVTPERKLQEILIAQEISRQYDKNTILEIYLNEIFFGNQSYGVQAAADFYFDKDASELNVGESALLTGLIAAPATFDPVVNPESAFERMDDVLVQMRRVECLQFQHEPFISEPFCVGDDQIRLQSGEVVGGNVLVEKAQMQIRQFSPREFDVEYPHFVNFVQAQVEQAFGTSEMYRRGFVIRTTLVPRIQDAAEIALERQVEALAGQGVNTGAVLVVNPATGAIRAMVGSPDFENEEIDGQVNNTLTFQQPGSAIKPVLYTAALEGIDTDQGRQFMTPATIIWDVPTTFPTTPPYSPVNFDGRFHGPVPLRNALQNSYNVPAVKVMDFIGISSFTSMSQRLGLNFADGATPTLASALGATDVRLYDLVQAYGVIANDGQLTRLYAIEEITDSDGTAIPINRREPEQVISPQVAYLMQNILSDDLARADQFGTGSGLTIQGLPTAGFVAAKTGTSDGSRDLWTVGFTSNIVTGVWLGTVNDTETTVQAGSLAATPLWNAIMRVALQGTQPEAFSPPSSGVVTVQVCSNTGELFDGTESCVPSNEIIIQGQQPPTDGFVQQLQIDSWTGLRGGSTCQDTLITRTFVDIDDAAAVDWLQNTASGQRWAQQLGLPNNLVRPPSQTCDSIAQRPNIQITQPTTGQNLIGQVDVIGAVLAPNFASYTVELGEVTDPNRPPDNFEIVNGPVTNQSNAGSVLWAWDTTTVDNGVYVIRLRANSANNGFVTQEVQVGVNNPIPTATPTPSPTPTIEPIEEIDPLPFDTPIPIDPIVPEADVEPILPSEGDPNAPLPFDETDPDEPPPAVEVPEL